MNRKASVTRAVMHLSWNFGPYFMASFTLPACSCLEKGFTGEHSELFDLIRASRTQSLTKRLQNF